MQARDLKVGDIFRIDEQGYTDEPLECIKVYSFSVDYKNLNTNKKFNLANGYKVVILEQGKEKILILKYITHNATMLTM